MELIMTESFVFTITAIIIIYDIVIAVKEKQTITQYFKRLYSQFIFVPFAIGFIFLGHFLDLIPNHMNVPAMIISGVIVLAISIIFNIKKVFLKPRWLCILPILAGYLIGDLFF